MEEFRVSLKLLTLEELEQERKKLEDEMKEDLLRQELLIKKINDTENYLMQTLAFKLFAGKDKSQILNEELKCQKCKTGPRAGQSHEWYQSTNFEWYTNTCHGKEGIDYLCDGCRGPTFDGYLKDLLTSEDMRFKCKNDGRGCQEYLGEEAMIFHESECIYRVVECPNLDCSAQVQFYKLLAIMGKKKEFLVAKIGIQQCQLTDQEFLTGKFKMIPIRFEMDGKVFFSIGQVEGETFYHWVYMIGSQFEANIYSYTLEYFGTSKSTCTYTGQVVPIDEPSHSIIKIGNCFGMSFKVFKHQFIDENFRFNYSVKIRNLKEEAKDENVESGVSDVSDDNE